MLSFFTSNAQTVVVSENFETTDLYDLPAGWFSAGDFFYNTYVDDYYGGCNDLQSLITNLYEPETSLYLTSPNYLNLNSTPKLVTFGLRIFDYDEEAPFALNFGTINFAYSSDNGITWGNLTPITNDSFTPLFDCQTISFTIPGSVITSLGSLKFKWEADYSGIGDYEIFIDNFLVTEEPTASNNEIDKSQLIVYPNPVLDLLHIEYATDVKKIQIYDLLGRQVYELNYDQNKLSVDVSDLASGTYLLKLETVDNKQTSIKFIKK